MEHCAVAIFDLDNCLLDARAVGPLFEPAFEAIRQANQGALAPAMLEQALYQCWFTAFDLVAERYRFTLAMRAAGWRQFSQLQVRAPLHGYPDIGLLPRIPLRRSMREEIRTLQQRLRLTVAYVTHDQSEALAVSDQIVVMNKGAIAQRGAPSELYEQPASEFVAGFMGEAMLFDGEARGDGTVALGPITLRPRQPVAAV